MRLRLTALRLGAVALAALAALPAAAGAYGRDATAGRWLTANGDGVIEIAACPDGLCGRITGMSDIARPDGSRPADPHGVPQCGLTILRLTKRGADGKWFGRIENPDDGSTWQCEVSVAEDGLHLRGYVVLPLLGQTQLWTHYAGQTAPDCTMGAR